MRSGAFRWSDALTIAAIPVAAFVIVALFRLGYDHYYLLPTHWTSNDPSAVFDVVKEIALFVSSELGGIGMAPITMALVLVMIGVVLLLRSDIRDFDDVSMFACAVCFAASFRFTPLVTFTSMWLILANKERVRGFLNRGIKEPVAPDSVNLPIVRRVAGALLLLSPFYFFGYAAAAGSHSYYVSESQPKFALLQTYNEYLICEAADIRREGDGTALTLKPSVKFFKIGESATPQFSAISVAQSIGPGSHVSGILSWLYIP